LATIEERHVDRPEYQDDSDVNEQPRQEMVFEEEDVHADHDGCHNEHVKRDGCLFSHCFVLQCAPQRSKSGIFLIQPLISAFSLASSASGQLAQHHELLYLLAIPALVPTTLAAYSVVGERQQGTLEPVLSTPVRREEFLLGKALAVLVPTIAISYVVFAVFVACVELFAQPGVAPALLRGSDVLAQLVFTPLLAGWSVWLGIAISTRASEIRVAQQVGILVNLPSILVTTLLALDTIHPTLAIAIGGAVLLLVLNAVGWRATSAMFDRERLITGTR
jgi:hypothetical protein